ncbi:glycerophosphodiester phosphodiesterase family protein [Planktotalea arctica]|uniref:glycerophosphodiester phosphodiesterase family protein n=1 Tax=Planktotalea arctica TaxID=1481893 RepID=UPI003219C4AF
MIRLDPSFLSQPLAHRALHDVARARPENSRAAIKAAIDAGYGIEIDVQLSSDGAAMVFHDYDLKRLAKDSGPIQQRSAADLGRVILRGSDEGIPGLPEVLDLIAGRVPLLIEIKDQDGSMGANVGRLEQAVARDIARYRGPLGVMSFNPHSVQQMAIHAPKVARGIVTSAYEAADWPLLPKGTRERLSAIPDFDTLRASFISHEVENLGAPRVADLKARGADILCWTVKSAEQEKEARKVADNITFEQYLAELPRT